MTNISLAVGIVFLAGVIGAKLARLIKLPSVTGNLLAGVLIGPSVMGLISSEAMYEMAPINELALGVIAFSIGAELHWATMKKLLKDVTKVFLVEALLTFAAVFTALYMFGIPFRYALVLASISIATAPGAIIACIREKPTEGDFSRVLLSIVAMDNLLAIITFGVVISFMQVAFSAPISGNTTPALIMASKDIGMSLVLGFIMGIFLVATSHRAKREENILVYSLGIILILVGISKNLEIPALLSAITCGTIYINFSKKPQRIIKAIMSVDHPILLLFLTLAGAKLDLTMVPAVGKIGFIYITARFAAKLIGSRLGNVFTVFPSSWKWNLGRALTPQAGVAIGLAIVAEQKSFLEPNTIMPVVLTAVIVFELIGPILVHKALCDVEASCAKQDNI